MKTRKCIRNVKYFSPATRDPDCQALHVAKPETISVTILGSWKENKVVISSIFTVAFL